MKVPATVPGIHVSHCQQSLHSSQRGSVYPYNQSIDSTISSRGRYISIKNEHLTMNARHIYNIVYMYIFTHTIHTTHIYNHIHLQIYVQYIYIHTGVHIVYTTHIHNYLHLQTYNYSNSINKTGDRKV